MAEHDEDKDVSRRYRELGRDEPPPALDAKIRAEARSALETHAAPLVPPTGRRRWYFPVAAAAIIMLAVAVTSQIEREQPAETLAPAPEELKKESVPQEKQRAFESKPQQAPKDERAAAPLSAERSREDFSRDNRARQERPATAPPPAGPPSAASQVQPQRNVQRDAGAGARAKVAEETPDAGLERIARLRAEGRHDDADKQLAEFRKRYPDYKIPPAMLEKVEKK